MRGAGIASEAEVRTDRVLAHFELADGNARRLRSWLLLPGTLAAFFGGFAIAFWLGFLYGDKSFLPLASVTSALTLLGVLGFYLMGRYPPDLPKSVAVRPRELRVTYDKKPVLSIPWAEPGSDFFIIDTPKTRGVAPADQRPIVLAFMDRIIVRLPESAMEVLKAEMSAQGLRFSIVSGATRRRWARRLDPGSTVLRISKA